MKINPELFEKLQYDIVQLKHEQSCLTYDLERMEFVLGEVLIMLNKIGKRAELSKDSFTSLWCESTMAEIMNTLNKPRYGVDVIAMEDIEVTEES